MKISELIVQFPWANHPLVRIFAESFSKEQWQDLTTAGVGGLIVNDKIPDHDLHKLLHDICEVANSPQVIELFESGEQSFKNLVEFQITEKLQEMEQEIKRYGHPLPTFQTFKSAINYLLSIGFDNNVLNELFSVVPEYAIDHSSVLATICSHTEKSWEEKLEALNESLDLYPIELLCNMPNASRSDVMDYVVNTLSYEQYKSISNSKVSVLFKPNPSIHDFENLKKQTSAVLSFFNYCKRFFLIEHENEIGSGYTLIQ